MAKKQLFTESELARLAKEFREKAKKTRAEAGREMGVKHPSVFHAEESPEQSLLKLRIRMIETYSPFEVVGPVFVLKAKGKKR